MSLNVGNIVIKRSKVCLSPRNEYSCETGLNGTNGLDGQDGVDGADGADGMDGQAGDDGNVNVIASSWHDFDKVNSIGFANNGNYHDITIISF